MVCIKIVSLISGGLDSTLMASLISEEKIEQFPLFINYGQLSYEEEWKACKMNLKKMNIKKPKKIDIENYGNFFKSGITAENLDIFEDAFLPNRNLLFLLIASSYAYQKDIGYVAIGLLDDKNHIFSDQTKIFLENAEKIINLSLNTSIEIIAPLKELNKKEVIKLASQREINNTYSCHSGEKEPCGECIACKEFININEGDEI